MSLFAAAAGQPVPAPSESEYVPGVCNIGPAEISSRRRTGHVGLLATLVLLGVLIVIDAPTLARWLLLIPAAIAASGYLQAYLRFCAGYGALGEFNFGPLGRAQSVADRDARRRDRIKAFEVGLASFVVGLGVASVAVALPV